jgi:hypothetical protein
MRAHKAQPLSALVWLWYRQWSALASINALEITGAAAKQARKAIAIIFFLPLMPLLRIVFMIPAPFLY